MNRRELYALGEPFGACCTRREAGRLICGGGGDSSSSSDVFNTVTNTDQRLALSNGLGISGDGSSIGIKTKSENTVNTTTNNSSSTNITTIDPGALRSMEMAMTAVREANQQNASGATSFAKLAESMLSQSFGFAKSAEINKADSLSEVLGFAKSTNAANADNLSEVLGFARRANDTNADGLAELLGFAKSSNAANASGFSQLLDVGTDLFKTNVGTFEKLLSKQYESVQNTQALTAQAYQTATAERAGTIDNKTIVVLGIAGAVAVVFAMRRKG